MVAESTSRSASRQRLVGPAADPADPDQRLGPRGVRSIHFLGGNGQHRLEQTDVGIADRELGRVDADGEAAGAGRGVVARQRPLPALVEPAVAHRARADARE